MSQQSRAVLQLWDSNSSIAVGRSLGSTHRHCLQSFKNLRSNRRAQKNQLRAQTSKRLTQPEGSCQDQEKWGNGATRNSLRTCVEFQVGTSRGKYLANTLSISEFQHVLEPFGLIKLPANVDIVLQSIYGSLPWYFDTVHKEKICNLQGQCAKAPIVSNTNTKNACRACK